VELSGRLALITGGAHRVGRALALAIAGAGADVIVHYHRSAEAAAATVAEAQAMGVQAVALPADLAAPDGPDQLFADIERRFGRLDVLVNSAAGMEAGDVLSLSRADWQRSLDLNLTAPFLCAQHAARLMLAKPPAEPEAAEPAEAGCIVNIADLAGLQAWARYPAHSVSKAGLIALTQVLAKALAPRIRVNAVAPGTVLRPADWSDERWQALANRTLLKRAGTPADVARAALYLLQAGYVTGETLVVDGGRRIA
jgi:NAD(P)-dependent dehydrogenase (short-subunit alcohol dehydrogenase family)